MTLSINTLRRLGTILALTTAIAGVAAAPAALANHQDVGPTEALREMRMTAPTSDAVDRYLRNDPQSATSAECDAVSRYHHNHVDDVRVITDTLGGNGQPKQMQGFRFTTDTLAPGGGTSTQLPAPAGEGFRWVDAGVGAATAVGSMLVLLCGTLVVLRKRHRLVV
jgi:hypothetical protein